MSKFIKIMIPVTILGLCMLLLSSCGGGNATASPVVRGAILVNTISPEIGSIVVMGEYIGTMEPNQQVAVLPRLPGEVLSVYFSVGDTVEAGDVLFTVDASDIENNIASLEAQLAVQDATVRAAQTGVSLVDGSVMQSQLLTAYGGVNQALAAIAQGEENMEQALISIELAQMAYDMAAQGYADTTILFEAGIVSRSVFEHAEAEFTNAQAGLERAKSGYALAVIGLDQAQLAHTQALEGQRILIEDAPVENRRRATDALAQAQAARDIVIVNLQMAKDMLEDAIVTSPINGVIVMRNVDEFGFAAPGSPAFLISDSDNMQVAFRVPRATGLALQAGDSITLVDGADEHMGTITEIGVMVDPGGMITIRATVTNTPAHLLSGTSVRILAEAQRVTDVLKIPLNALHHVRGEAHVFVADGGFARMVSVETGIFDGFYVEILSGIAEDELIIESWSARLADGEEIEINAHNSGS